MMRPVDYVNAARVPRTVPLGDFGLWTIERWSADGLNLPPRERDLAAAVVGFRDQTLLRRHTDATMHLRAGVVVMEDSIVELSKHLPIWMEGRGDVLVTGLGLGCVVRGLLANPRVDSVFVIEKDPTIIELIGPEFWGDPRVTIYLDDALAWEPDGRMFDLAWHDLWIEGDGLQLLHAQLFRRFHHYVGRQGAWAFPRWGARLLNRSYGIQLLGAPR